MDDNNLMEKARAKIRDFYIESFPNQLWEGIIQQEHDTLFAVQRIKDKYTDEIKEKPSEISIMVKDILREEYKQRIRQDVVKRLEKLDWKDEQTNEFIIEVVKQAVPNVLQYLLQDIVNSVASSIKHALADRRDW